MWLGGPLDRLLPPSMKFQSNRMLVREDRLKEAKSNAERCGRELARDRKQLERQEHRLMVNAKDYYKKGDKAKARILAAQIAGLRNTSNRNFQGSAIIQNRAQVMASNHKINRAEMEAMKGTRYANYGVTQVGAKMQTMKYAQRMMEDEVLEELMNEGMDDVSPSVPLLGVYGDIFDSGDIKTQVDDVFTQIAGFSGAAKAVEREERDMELPPRPKKTPAQLEKVTVSNVGPSRPTTALPPTPKPDEINMIHFRLYEATASAGTTSRTGGRVCRSPSSHSVASSSSKPLPRPAARTRVGSIHGASFRVPNLDWSVDMLKREMMRDAHVVNELRLSGTGTGRVYKRFMLGKVVRDKDGVESFEAYDFTHSLKQIGLGDGGEILVMVIEA
ncbi:hypothetical protein HK101_000168 [Irineochytrium annulatum]|nr:hypothetical protein HK101_000168 [Irineochytrium annulatum]